MDGASNGCLATCLSPLVDGYFPRDALKFIQVQKWTGASNGYLATCLSLLVDGYIPRDALKFIKSTNGWVHPTDALQLVKVH